VSRVIEIDTLALVVEVVQASRRFQPPEIIAGDIATPLLVLRRLLIALGLPLSLDSASLELEVLFLPVFAALRFPRRRGGAGCRRGQRFRFDRLRFLALRRALAVVGHSFFVHPPEHLRRCGPDEAAAEQAAKQSIRPRFPRHLSGLLKSVAETVHRREGMGKLPGLS